MTSYRPAVYSSHNGLRNGNGGNNGNDKPILITGRDVLAFTNRGEDEKAGRAAQWVRGDVQLIKPTVAQAALVYHATVHNTYAALHLAPEALKRVVARELSLAAAARGNRLVTVWLNATPAEKAAFGIAIGVNEVWDAAISPSI
jgi:hypothetical protein